MSVRHLKMQDNDLLGVTRVMVHVCLCILRSWLHPWRTSTDKHRAFFNSSDWYLWRKTVIVLWTLCGSFLTVFTLK